MSSLDAGDGNGDRKANFRGILRKEYIVRSYWFTRFRGMMKKRSEWLGLLQNFGPGTIWTETEKLADKKELNEPTGNSWILLFNPFFEILGSYM